MEAPTLDAMERKRRQLLMNPNRTTGPLPEFEQARRNVQADVGVQSRAAGMALNRQRAQAGGFGSGGGIKLGQQVEQQLQEQKQRALNDVTAQESAAVRAMEMQREQMQAAGLEAERGRGFQSDEALKGRVFQRGMFDEEQAFKNTVFKSEEKNKIDILDLERQKQRFDEGTAGFNKIISALSLESPAEKTRLLSSVAEDFKRDGRPEYQKLAEGLQLYINAADVEKGVQKPVNVQVDNLQAQGKTRQVTTREGTFWEVFRNGRWERIR